MATTISYFVLAKKKRSGSFSVSIRVTHNRKIRYMPTNLQLDDKQLSRDCKVIRDKQVLEMINDKIHDLRKTLYSISDSELYDVDTLIDRLVKKSAEPKKFRLDFFDYADQKAKDRCFGTAIGWQSSLSAFERFLGDRKIDINDITAKMILAFRRYLEEDEGKKGCRSVSKYMTDIRTIHNMAKREYNDDDDASPAIPRNPFPKGSIPQQAETEHRVLTKEQLSIVFSTPDVKDSARDRRADIARDVAMMSFLLAGMNSADLFDVSKDCLAEGLLTYERAKTRSVRMDKAKMTIRIEPELDELFGKYLDPNPDSPYLFTFHNRYSTYRNFNHYLNLGLKEIAKAHMGELPVDLQFYHFRHTWATLAYQIGIDFNTIHEALNHAKQGNDRVTAIYIQRDFSNIWAANRKVIDHVLH